MRNIQEQGVPKFPAPVQIQSVAIAGQDFLPDGTLKTRMQLKVVNPLDMPREFAVQLKVPEGILISDFKLRIGTEMVPGRLHESRASLWVYNNIRTAEGRPKDPAVLRYLGRDTLELRIWPVLAKEVREVELEFWHSAAVSGRVEIGPETWLLNTGAEENVAELQEGNQTRWVTLPETVAQELAVVQREPVLHFIVDRSAGAVLTSRSLEGRLMSLASAFPQARQARVSFGNVNFRDFTQQPVDFQELGRMLRAAELPAAEGGFLRDRALKLALMRWRWELREASESSPLLRQYPVFIVVRDGFGAEVTEGNLSAYAEGVAPELGHFYSAQFGREPEAVSWNGTPLTDPGERNDKQVAARRAAERKQVALLRVGGANVAVAKDRIQQGVALQFASLAPVEGVWNFDSSLNGFSWVAPLRVREMTGAFEQVAEQWRAAWDIRLNPAREARERRALVEAAREKRLLLPQTTFCVMENAAQWESLRRAEARTLKGRDSADLSVNDSFASLQTVAPAAWLWLALLAVAAALRSFRERFRKATHDASRAVLPGKI